MNPPEFLEGIRSADRHRGGVRVQRLFHLEPEFFSRLRSEVERLCGAEASSDVTTPEHVTRWAGPYGQVRQFSLLNATGRFDDFRRDHDLSCFGKRFHHQATYPALGKLIEGLPHTTNVRVSSLGPEAGLSAHEEQLLFRTRDGTVGARLRFHLPVETNPRADLVLDGDVHHLEAGTVYFVNHGCVHSASNRGSRPRTHLTWDMLLTRAVFAVMFGDEPPPPPLLRIASSDRGVPPLRTEEIGGYRRLQPSIAAEDAESLAFCAAQ